MVIRIAVLLLAVLLNARFAGAEEVYRIKAGDTMGHIALKFTRNANNWRKSGIEVENVSTRKAIAKDRYDYVQVGWIVRISDSLVSTKSVAASGKTLTAICAQYAETGCLTTLAKINMLSKTRDQAIADEIRVPTGYRTIEAAAPSVTASRSAVADNVQPTTKPANDSAPQPAKASVFAVNMSGGKWSMVGVAAIVLLFLLVGPMRTAGHAKKRREQLRNQMEQASRTFTAEFARTFYSHRLPLEHSVEYFLERECFHLTLSHPEDAYPGDRDYRHKVIERLERIRKEHPDILFSAADPKDWQYHEGKVTIPIVYNPS